MQLVNKFLFDLFSKNIIKEPESFMVWFFGMKINIWVQ